jgi:hypothetical protein
MSRVKKSSNCDDSDGDEDVENVEKTIEREKDTVHDQVKVQTTKDRFQTPEMYVSFHQGPTVIGGKNNVFLLRDPTEIQKAIHLTDYRWSGASCHSSFPPSCGSQNHRGACNLRSRV